MIGLALTATNSLAQWTYEPFTFNTLAGFAQFDINNDPVFGSADGAGSEARFNYPSGVAVDSAGNAYVADTGNNRIRKMTSAGVVTTLAGSASSSGYADGTGSAAQFYFPSGLAVDSSGTVYVADTENHTIRKVTAAGVVTTLAGLAKVFGSTDGTGSEALFDSPSSVAADSAGNVYVADFGNQTIRKVTPVGVVTTLAGLSQPNPDGLGGFVGGSADGTGNAARFHYPRGVAVDSTGNVYVADAGNHTIRKVTQAGVVTTLGGLAGSFGSVDGTGSAARFGSYSTCCSYAPGPYGVAVDGAGNVYVADTRNNTIRKGYPALLILNSGPGFGLNSGQFGFTLTGPAGKLVIVEASTDLVSWVPVRTNTFTGVLNFSDSQNGVGSERFYRARMP
jgi:sugar lactone lactonase YvrE